MKEFDRPCIIYLHGNSSSRIEGHVYAGALCEEGFSLVSFDFAGSGHSDGEYVTLGWYEKDDVRTVIEYLRKN
jgi:alpha/beta superfamily hydrolase